MLPRTWVPFSGGCRPPACASAAGARAAPAQRAAVRTAAAGNGAPRIKVVGVGGCGVDYLASVAAYPRPDDKLRTEKLEVRSAVALAALYNMVVSCDAAMPQSPLRQEVYAHEASAERLAYRISAAAARWHGAGRMPCESQTPKRAAIFFRLFCTASLRFSSAHRLQLLRRFHGSSAIGNEH